MSNYKITPMTVSEIEALIGKDFVLEFQKRMSPIIDPLRYHINLGRPLSMGKELWEYVVADSIEGAEWNGAGKSALDVRLTGDNRGIDVKSVGKRIKSKMTAEASMFQNFNQDAKTHFKDKNSEGIWNIYIDGWSQKANSYNEYYLMGIVREKETLNCSLCCFSVKKHNLVFDEANCRYTGKFMYISGLADPELLHVRYYNSKSRLEVLFQKKCWTDPNYCLQIFKY